MWLPWNIAERFSEMDQNRSTYCKRVPYHSKSRVLSFTVGIRLLLIYRVITPGLRNTVQEEEEEEEKKGGWVERKLPEDIGGNLPEVPRMVAMNRPDSGREVCAITKGKGIICPVETYFAKLFLSVICRVKDIFYSVNCLNFV